MPRTSNKLLFGATLIVLLAPLVAFALVSQLAFTTESQSIKPSEISGTLTVQLQDASGNSAQATETVDVEFLSTSATGEFLSPSSENPVTKTISTGSANKNFRYRDSATGSFTLTVNAKGRTSGTTWSATQGVTISNTVSTATSSGAGETSTSGTASNGNTSNSTSPTSAHYSAEPLSQNQETEALVSVSAGRDRLGAVGSPLEFRAQSSLAYTKNGEFQWNFGDGTLGYGEVVSHTYEYAGEYVLVLNTAFPEGKAVSRASVKIVDPALVVLVATPERIELKNNAPQEVSLFGRVLFSGAVAFVFPQDTIVGARQSLSFSSMITGLHPTSPKDVQILVVGQAEEAIIHKQVEVQKGKRVAELTSQISELKYQLGKFPRESLTIASTTDLRGSSSNTATALTSFRTVTASTSWFKTLKTFFLGRRNSEL